MPGAVGFVAQDAAGEGFEPTGCYALPKRGGATCRVRREPVSGRLGAPLLLILFIFGKAEDLIDV